MSSKLDHWSWIFTTNSKQALRRPARWRPRQTPRRAHRRRLTWKWHQISGWGVDRKKYLFTNHISENLESKFPSFAIDIFLKERRIGRKKKILNRLMASSSFMTLSKRLSLSATTTSDPPDKIFKNFRKLKLFIHRTQQRKGWLIVTR